MLKQTLTHAMRRTGFDLVRYPYPEYSQLRSALARLFDTLQIDCVLDVGANEGQYGTFLRAMGFTGWIVSFEPVPEVFATLQSVSDAKWRVCPYALGAHEGTAQIHVTHGTGFSSFRRPDPAHSRQHATWNTVDRLELVRVRRLDAVWTEVLAGLPSPQAVYLKMDTQGFDSEVLTGAAGVLGQIAALQTELSWEPVYHDMPDALSVIAQCRAAGFAVADMIPVSRREGSLAAMEMDCLMVRAD